MYFVDQRVRDIGEYVLQLPRHVSPCLPRRHVWRRRWWRNGMEIYCYILYQIILYLGRTRNLSDIESRGAPKFGLDRISAEGFGSVRPRFNIRLNFGRTSVLFVLAFALRSAHFIACVQTPQSVLQPKKFQYTVPYWCIYSRGAPKFGKLQFQSSNFRGSWLSDVRCPMSSVSVIFYVWISWRYTDIQGESKKVDPLQVSSIFSLGLSLFA